MDCLIKSIEVVEGTHVKVAHEIEDKAVRHIEPVEVSTEFGEVIAMIRGLAIKRLLLQGASYWEAHAELSGVKFTAKNGVIVAWTLQVVLPEDIQDSPSGASAHREAITISRKLGIEEVTDAERERLTKLHRFCQEFVVDNAHHKYHQMPLLPTETELATA